MKVDPNVPADRLYNEGLIKLENKDYETAAKRFAECAEAISVQQWARKSVLMEVYSNYLNASYTDDFRLRRPLYFSFIPIRTNRAYVNYLAGRPDRRDARRSPRPGPRHEGDQIFPDVVDKYPKSEYAPDARLKIADRARPVGRRRDEVGRYYLKRHNYTAAINRFREVLFKYQNTREAEEALERLTEAYLAMGLVDEAQTAAAVLGHNYPNSEWYRRPSTGSRTRVCRPTSMRIPGFQRPSRRSDWAERVSLYFSLGAN